MPGGSRRHAAAADGRRNCRRTRSGCCRGGGTTGQRRRKARRLAMRIPLKLPPDCNGQDWTVSGTKKAGTVAITRFSGLRWTSLELYLSSVYRTDRHKHCAATVLRFDVFELPPELPPDGVRSLPRERLKAFGFDVLGLLGVGLDGAAADVHALTGFIAGLTGGRRVRKCPYRCRSHPQRLLLSSAPTPARQEPRGDQRALGGVRLRCIHEKPRLKRGSL